MLEDPSDAWVTAVCVLETAILLSRLGDLPNDPHRPRARLELEQIYHRLERIRRWLGSGVRSVLHHAEREPRATADRLGCPLPIERESEL
jgi:hypothetical protein